MSKVQNKRQFDTFESLRSEVGKELGISPWHTVNQEQINTFAEATGDHQWIHVDVDRATKESPYGAPIAHGHLTLSLVPMLISDTIEYLPRTAGINYGLDKVRFMSPVKSGARVRGRISLRSAERTNDTTVKVMYTTVVEIEGEEKPACVAESIALYLN
ncbi:MAG: hypothetical protein CMM58_06450 [Rhodospirillaceae bacterium]|nr:hypothetical protein [Rhodospirillaceae bacterium]